jgi:hypothetical protein
VAEIAPAKHLNVPSGEKLVSNEGHVQQRRTFGHLITDVPETGVGSLGKFSGGLQKGEVLRIYLH